LVLCSNYANMLFHQQQVMWKLWYHITWTCTIPVTYRWICCLSMNFLLVYLYIFINIIFHRGKKIHAIWNFNLKMHNATLFISCCICCFSCISCLLLINIS
jgi:hypothetical protein